MELIMSHKVIAAALLLLGFTTAAFAQESGNVNRGRMLAQMTCAECHAIGKNELRSRNGQAPTFAALANTRGINAMDIRVALRTSHREMPNLSLNDEQVEDVAAYILSLK
jgi:mono/diheme cytochrome c family protein